jgi:signal transduction histidine kinase/ActR/RegA family two-component response regulator
LSLVPVTPLLYVATSLQIVAVIYCVVLLRKHWGAAAPWLCLLGTMLSMLVWRVVVTTGVTPSPLFNTTIAISGSVCAVLAMFYFGREVTRRARAEEERDRLLASERAARTDAESASRIKDDFLATLSHELRTPLAAILGWCMILRKAPVGSVEATRALDTVERNASMQARLVDDLLDATRMQARSLHLELAPVSLAIPVAAALEGVRPAAEAKHLTIAYTCEGAAPTVIGDASRLQQVVSNLLVNAVKFTPDGRTVRVSLTATATHAVLTVADEGVGIDPDFMPQLFQRFRQADSSRTRRHSGLGLGLSIVWSLVQLHHGEIQASSDGADAGATFVVRLPLADADAATSVIDHPSSRTGATSSYAIQDVRVLVVDDEADVRGALVRLLEQAGGIVLALESGATIDAAMDRFQPDVLVLDIGMPGEDGYTLIRRIRRRSASARQVPAISLTAHAREEDRQHAIASGFQAHLAKPVDLPLLLSTMQLLVRDQDRRRTS